MSSARRLHYEGIIYRFKFLMIATLLCASLTITGFILGEVNEKLNLIFFYLNKRICDETFKKIFFYFCLKVAEGQWKWDQDIKLEMTSAFFTGVYGMWNIYIMALLCLYAPSHKQWPIEPSGKKND